MNQEIKKRIFYEELFQLKKYEMIEEDVYQKVGSAYSHFNKNRDQMKLNGIIRPQKVQAVQGEVVNRTDAGMIDQNLKAENKSDMLQKADQSIEAQIQNNQPQSPDEIHIPKPVQKVERVIKAPNPQDIRDKNITWVLIIGVVLVLMSGLIFATTNWSSMGAGSKSAMILSGTLMFFGVSWLAGEKLKIAKTSFAFWVLGSLFLPVSILTAGFFKLFGVWLSISGEGKYLFGFMGALTCIPVYILSTYKFRARFFAWLSLITMSIGVIFFILIFSPGRDLFYLMIILYNGALLLGNVKLKNNLKLIPFTDELLSFTQINLILSSLFILCFYNNAAFNSFNVILTAVIYISMVYSQNKKGYVYVFIPLLVYGIYQLSQNTALINFDLLVIALIGVILVGMEKIKPGDQSLNRVFQIANGIISFFAFIFISLKAIEIREMGTPSFYALVAYMVLCLNYMYLSYKTKRSIFSFLIPVFIMVVANQSYELLNHYLGFKEHILFMFLWAMALFIVFYLYNWTERFKNLKLSSAIVSIISILLCIVIAISDSYWTLGYIMFFVLGGILYTINTTIKFKLMKEILKIFMAILWFLGIITVYGDIQNAFHYPFDMYFGISVLVLFLLSLVARYFKKDLERAFFWVSQALIPIAVLVMSIDYYDNPLSYLIPCGIYVYSMFRIKNEVNIRIFLYLSFITGTIGISSIISMYGWDEFNKLTIFISSCIIFILCALLKKLWKKRIAHFFIPLGIIGIVVMNYEYLSLWRDTLLSLLLMVLVLFVLHREKLIFFGFVPMIILAGIITNMLGQFEGMELYDAYSALVWATVFLGLHITGKLLHKNLFGSYEGLGKFYIDWYSIFAIIYVLPVYVYLSSDNFLPNYIDVLPDILVAYFAFSQIKRVGEGIFNKKVTTTVFAMSVLLPYYKGLSILNVDHIIKTELLVFPLLILSIVSGKLIWNDYSGIMRKINGFVLGLITVILFNDIILYSYLFDAFVVGILSLVSIIWGMQKQIKSYFFIGSGALLLNMLIQTKSLWSSIPWWGYLLIAGLILIVVASINEMQKNKSEEEKVSAKKVIDIFKDWE